MPERLTKRERLARTIAGRDVDRLPVALWRHFFREETTRSGLVRAMTEWQTTYDWDFLKINPRASYHVEDWGNRYAFSENAHIPPSLVQTAVHRPDDFGHLDRLDPTGRFGGAEAPVLAEHRKVIEDLREALGDEVPLLATIFSPMSLAAELAGGPQDLAGLIDDNPGMVHVGLRTITDTFRDYATACLDAGADGLFFATTHVATTVNFTLETYEEFGRPYDLEVLEVADHAPLNCLHVCQPRAMVRDLVDYPVEMLNWDTAADSNPDIAGLAPLARDKALVGGLDKDLFTADDAAERLTAQLAETREAMQGRPFVVAATCTIPSEADPAVVAAVRDAVKE